MNAPIITDKGCKNCRFSVPAPNGGRECRHSPPTANAILAPDGKGGMAVQAVVSLFPLMMPDAFCHRYERGLVMAKAS